MIFSSLEFLFLYFAAVLIIYYITPFKFRNLVLLIVSLIFYGWGEPVYVFIMIFSICVDYICGWQVSKYKEKNKDKIAKRFVVASVAINLSVLGFFKYADFFINNLKLIPVLSFLHPLNIALPIGISFYTFQTMSYVLDIYMDNAKVQKNITSFGMYVTLFPQLVAGPIVRYKDIDEQIRHRKESVAMFACGVRTFICGMCKKVLFANTAGAIWTYIKALPESDITVVGAWLGIVAFTFQIYFDFSGYSDMAIGVGRMMGFHYPENFNYPYIATSVTDFWRRWHISLSSFFRDYVYIPLGGNRVSNQRWILNMLIVWLLTGFWHGAAWNFILWGLYFGVILIIEKFFLREILEKLPVLRNLYVIIVFIFGWVIFRAESVSHIGEITASMFGANGAGSFTWLAEQDIVQLPHLFALVAGIICSMPVSKYVKKFFEDSYVGIYFIDVATVIALVVCVFSLAVGSYNPFIYFIF